ncbi:MAG: ketoacyl-ACP synthase III [Sphingomonadaceae bacterium]|uniref:beta-ketoacyl-ACP synthase III n=1 Tax=Thermaurantiacus sp. TaxID=2820283 RepID=UPI00298EE5FF|nr:beta-ketoacyl-ACP synthase III [Thermaurantiacus sp.]MCS6987112.1 ketoacyl-ACP synthase III [Sphingomonadaceae bacterium]MDW8415550.1 beta-ketoacyl-ACP synthase III [Thermaurantiacus sp.]
MPVAVLRGTGGALPPRRVTNDELAARLATSDAWIVERTGIRARHLAPPGMCTSDLAVAAAQAALVAAGTPAQAIDLVVVATSTPDRTFPATATAVQARLGITGGAAFDLQAVCSGFVYALAVADSLLRTAAYRRALVIGAELFSRILDWDDRATAVLFGDGAGAVVLEAMEPAEAQGRGILAARLRADGRYGDLLYVDGGPGTTGTVGRLRMQGREVFRHAVVNLADIVHETAILAGVSVADIDWLVPHQANRRIIEATARKLGLPMERVIVTVDEHANTSAASVPLALDQGIRDGRIRPGQLCLLEAMGGGFTWGAVLLRI